MDSHISNITQNFLSQSQEAIQSLGKCLESLQQECLENNKDLQLDQIQLFDRYERFLANLTSLQMRSTHIKDKMVTKGSPSTKESRAISFKNDLSTLMENFAELSAQLSDLSNDIGNTPSGQETQKTPGSAMSFEPKPLKIIAKSIFDGQNRSPDLANDSQESYTMAHKQSPIKKRHSRRRNSNDEMTLPSIFNGRNRISIALFQEDENSSFNNSNINDDETVIFPILGPTGEESEDDQKSESSFAELNQPDILRPMLRRYNSHESILSIKRQPLSFFSPPEFAPNTMVFNSMGIGCSRASTPCSNSFSTATATTATVSSSTTMTSKRESSRNLLLSQISTHAPVAQKRAPKAGFWDQLRKYTTSTVETKKVSSEPHSKKVTNTRQLADRGQERTASRRLVSIAGRSDRKLTQSGVQKDLLAEALSSEINY